MNKKNIDYLRRHIHHWHTLRDAGYIQHVNDETARELLKIAQEEFDTRYLICLRHPQNICELIRYVYSQAASALEGCGAATPVVVMPVKPAANKGHAEKRTDLRKPKPVKAKGRCNDAKYGRIIPDKAERHVITSAGKQGTFAAARPPPGKKVCRSISHWSMEY